MTVAVLMLQALACKRCTTRCATEQKATGAHVACSPDKVAYTLESEHRVVNEERDGVDPMRRISSSGCDKRGDRSGLGDAFFQDLSVFRFLVVEQGVAIYWLVELSNV